MSSQTMTSLRPESVIRQLPWQFDSKAALGFLLILATFSLVGWLYLTQASAVTTTSYRIDELRLEIDQIENQNAVLALEIAELEALPHVESRARELGFEPTTSVRYLPVVDYPVNVDETAPVRTELELALSNAGAHVVEPASSSWWIDTLDNFADWLEENKPYSPDRPRPQTLFGNEDVEVAPSTILSRIHRVAIF